MRTGASRIFALLAGIALALSAFGGVSYAQGKGPKAGDETQLGPDAPNTITLPDTGSTSTSGTAWSVTNTGTGRVAYFNLNNPSTNNPAIEVRTVSSTTSALGVLGIAAASQGGSFSAGVRGVNGSTTAKGYGVIGTHNGAGAGIYGYAVGAGGRGVYGLSLATSGEGKGIHGESRSISGYGVYGSSPNIAVYAKGGYQGVVASGSSIALFGNGGEYGVYANGGMVGVYANSNGSSGVGMHGEANIGSGAIGVSGLSSQGIGVKGDSGAGVGVQGNSPSSIAIEGKGKWGLVGRGSYIGVFGEATAYGFAVYGKALAPSTWAGYFEGQIRVTSGCVGCAASTARIDHPLDAAKYVEQSDVLASERLGIQRGNATLDAKGEAVVKLPAWFQQIYADFSYNLTTVGGFAPVYIADEIKNSEFRIVGGKPGMKVSWQVSGARQDKYAKEHPLKTEGLKRDDPKPLAPPEPPQSASMPMGVQMPVKQ